MDREDGRSNLSGHNAETGIDREPSANSDRDATLASAGPLPVRSPQPNLPTTIGHYCITRLLGEGGMGAVYEAQQEQPRRLVALKVIKAALASPDLLTRFQQESQALARLHHPGIAQIYEAGSAETPVGVQPFFAMELIQGKPLAQYADEHKLTPRQRLELMIQVCDAVHHAHQRGIIHRDLKPGNILVDESGQPKILDFGLARATDSDAQATRQTDVGQLLGTLAYMSPEQVLADPLALDVRTDIYALGVILYEVLAGKMPYTLSRQLHEAVRTIQETDPAPLSSISKVYRGDVETIATKALEKDKTRRYGSAAELAADIRRHLRDEPIAARPPSTTYQLQKFARRNRALVTGVAAVFVVLVAGVVASTWEAVQARRAEAKARQESAIAQAVNDFLQNDLLGQASAYNQSKPDPDIKVRTVLDRAAQRIDGKFPKQPEVEAGIRGTIGQAYGDLGQYPEARTQMERALELDRRTLGTKDARTLKAMGRLARLAQLQGKYPEAEALLSQTLKIRRGVPDPDMLRYMNNLAIVYSYEGKKAQAEALDSQILEIRRHMLGPEHPETLASMNNLAYDYEDEGKYEQAEALHSQSLEIQRRVLGPEHPETLRSMSNLAIVYNYQGRYAQAEQLGSQTSEMRRRALGPEHPDTLESMHNLAWVYSEQGKYAQAEALDSQTLEIQRRVLGLEHPDTLRSMNNLAWVYIEQGKYAQAEALDSQTLEIQRRVLGPEHPNTLASIETLAVNYGSQGRYAQSEKLFGQCLEAERRVLGPENSDTLSTLSDFAFMYQQQGKYALAETYTAQALAGRRHSLGAEHPNTMVSANNLALAYVSQGKFAESEPLAREAIEVDQKNQPGDWQRFHAESLLGESLTGEKKYAEAEPLLLEGYQGMLARKDRIDRPDHYHLELARRWLIQFYQAWGKPDKAARLKK